MSISYIESLPERCLELILDYLNLEDFNTVIKCCKRLQNIGKEVSRMREIRLHQVLRQNGTAKWQLLYSKNASKKETSPGQRFGSTLVYYDSSIYLFGGATVNWTSFNDLWRFDLCEKVWSRRITGGTCPTPRAGATGIVINDKLIIIGGFQLLYNIYAKNLSNWDNLPWIYDFTKNEWKMVNVDTSLLPIVDDDCATRRFTISPSPVGQSSCLMMDDKIVLFGGAKSLLNQSQGYHRQSPIHPFGLSNDSYCLSVTSWEISAIKIVGDVRPMKRCGHSGMAIDRNKMIIIGGNLGPNTKCSEDMWMLTCVESLDDSCVCVAGKGRGGGTGWFWTRIEVEMSLPSLLPFLGNAMVFTGDSRVTSTVVVLGGEQGRLMVHSLDLTDLLVVPRCPWCQGEVTVAAASLAWSTTSPLRQDLSHAPLLKQGFALAAGHDSVFVHGGLCAPPAAGRHSLLLCDLMVRDYEDAMLAIADLHQLTFAGPAITL